MIDVKVDGGRNRGALVERVSCFHEDFGVWVERHAVDAARDEERRELGVIARRLAAQTDLSSEAPCVLDGLCNQFLHRRVALVEDVRDDGRIAIDAERELRQIVGSD